MDEERVKGAVGGTTGDSETQAEGSADQVSGQLQNVGGSAKNSAQEAAGMLGAQLDSFMKGRPMAALFSAVGAGYPSALILHRR